MDNCRFAMRGWSSDRSSGDLNAFPYSVSGAYRRGESTPLWHVDWYAHAVDLLDCEHLVRHGPWATSLDDLAVAFYRRGFELMTYQVGDLVTDSSLLQYTVSHFMWRHDMDLDAAESVLRIDTLDGHRYLFSVETGEIVHHKRFRTKQVAGQRAIQHDNAR